MIDAITINIISNTLFEILKNITTKKIEKSKITKKIECEFDKDVINIDSGSFNKFLKTYEIENIFYNYIKYQAFATYKDINYKPEYINRESLKKQLVKKCTEFITLDLGECNISGAELEKCFENILKSIEGILIENLTNEDIIIPYFINERLKELELRIISHINNPLITDKEKMESYRNDYMKILKEKYSNISVFKLGRYNWNEFYIEPKLVIMEEENDILKETSYKVGWKNIFENSNIVSVIGGPGCGKTLFSQFLISNFEKLSIYKSEMCLPIYCDLKMYIKERKKNTSYSINDFLISCMVESSGMDSDKINHEFLELFINSGRCLIVLDALDEVTSTERKELSEKIIAYFSQQNSNNNILITTRERSLIPSTKIIYKIMDIILDDVKLYGNKMQEINSNVTGLEIFEQQCEELIEKKFLKNFLTLTLLFEIFIVEKDLPRQKVELYRKCTEYISYRRELDKSKCDFNFDNFRNIIKNSNTFEKLSNSCKYDNEESSEEECEAILLEEYNDLFNCKNDALNAINEFLNYCSCRTELFICSEEEKQYRFFHRSFFEYFYSQYMIKNMNNKEIFLEFSKFDYDSEIFELVLASLGIDDYKRQNVFLQEFIEYLKNETIINKNLYFQIAIDFLGISPQVSFKQKFFELCCSEKAFLNYSSKLNYRQACEYITDIIKEEEHFDMFVKALINYYKDDFFGSILKKKVLAISDEDVKISLNEAIWLIINALPENFEEIISFIEEDEFTEFINSSDVDLESLYEVLEIDVEYEYIYNVSNLIRLTRSILIA